MGTGRWLAYSACVRSTPPPTPADALADREEAGAPRVWALLGHRAGDNAQVRALAEALPWPAEVKHLAWRRPRPPWTPLYARRATLSPLDRKAREALVPPWPDLVVSIGWRSVPVARWIAARSSGRLVALGRPRAPLNVFDLVLTTPQYRLPDAPNVLRLDGPVGGLDINALAAAGSAWRPRLDHLPRPWIAVLVGGSAFPYHIGPREGAALGGRVNALARARGGSLLVAGSPRTGGPTLEALAARVDVPLHLHRWDAGSENPYRAFLALADAFVVTGESVSMMQEARLTGRPVFVFEPPDLSAPFRPPPRDASEGGWRDALRRRGLLPSPRRVDAFRDALYRAGQARALSADGAVAEDAHPTSPAEDQTARAIEAIVSLMGSHPMLPK